MCGTNADLANEARLVGEFPNGLAIIVEGIDCDFSTGDRMANTNAVAFTDKFNLVQADVGNG
jgi:hypothetical protein